MQINLQAPINQTSYGIAATNILRELVKTNEVALFPIGGLDISSQEIADLVSATHYRNRTPSFFARGHSLKIWHQFDLAETIGRGKKVGMVFFELDRLSEIERTHCQSLDLVLTSSTYHRDILRANGCASEFVSLGVDRSLFHENVAPVSFGAIDDSTKYLVVGKWEQRKNHQNIIKAFCEAFTANDNVSLIMLCHNPFLIDREPSGAVKRDGNKEWESYYKNSSMGHRVLFIDRVPGAQNLASIMRASDCLLTPSKAEGYNLPLAEYLSTGGWAITTDCTAMKDYPNEAFAFPNGNIDMNTMMMETTNLKIPMLPTATEIAFDPPFFNGQGAWFEFGAQQMNNLIERMQLVHKIKQSTGSLPMNTEGIYWSKQTTWQEITKQLVSYIDRA